MMKLILTTTIDKLGLAGDVVEVRDGYGRNYLIPQGKAILWTKGGEKQIEGIKRAQEARAIRDLDHAREIRTQLEQLTDVKVPVKTSEKGKLFGSVSAEDIVAAVETAGGPKLDKRIVVLPKGLVKKTGNYQVELKLHADVLGKVNFSVVAA